ncbi:Cytidine and deoxycytidylate deaminase zinc-binding region containing protein, putative [Angomonas deanei]|uniref:Cytidine and deoxycytidylate deaminase zinc-binding region containing protein, putative n=1 Tax=Angomonas deanei TaxID=59799 RepID=A0A7G2CPN0_9TRYP|nr:Cytidine and deoxycytidylate deaminase zinc-binding region containing protein, putative [Angomonas deanei]
MSVTPLLKPITQFSKELQKLAEAAVRAQRQAYCPYSNFAVGAALQHSSSEITVGCNYENCTLQSCCAERCAIVKANVEGKRTATAVAVYGAPAGWQGVGDGTVVCPPCGLCRQLLVEVADLSDNYNTFQVLLVSRDFQNGKLFLLRDLMIEKFGPADVGVDLAVLRQGK